MCKSAILKEAGVKTVCVCVGGGGGGGVSYKVHIHTSLQDLICSHDFRFIPNPMLFLPAFHTPTDTCTNNIQPIKVGMDVRHNKYFHNHI